MEASAIPGGDQQLTVFAASAVCLFQFGLDWLHSVEMDATAYQWDSVNEDNPIDLLTRRTVFGERMMMARVRLAKGCHVAPHHHESEQIAVIVSGHVRWSIHPEGTPEHRYVEQRGGEVMVLPSNVVHGIDIYEDAEIIDVLTPIGPMGVDRQPPSIAG